MSIATAILVTIGAAALAIGGGSIKPSAMRQSLAAMERASAPPAACDRRRRPSGGARST